MTQETEFPPTPISTQKRAHQAPVEESDSESNEAEIDPFGEYIASPINSMIALLTPPISPTVDKENIPPAEEIDDGGFDVAAYEASITKSPKCTEDGFGERGYDGLWLWYSEIEKFQSTSLADFLKAREVPRGALISHTSYIGGRWFIPTVENNLFLSLYYRDCIRKGYPQFISERQLKWKKFHFIIDWDMNDTLEYTTFLTRNNLDELSFDRHFMGVVLRSIGHVIAGHGSIIYSKNPDIPYKIHIYFPTLLVKTADAGLEWLTLVQQEFMETFVVGDENWEKIFDRGVLKNGSSSLRMLGSQSAKRNGAYKIFDLISGEFKDISPRNLADAILRTEIDMDDSPYKEDRDPEFSVAPVTSANVESLKKYTKALADAKAFPQQTLKFKDAKPGFFARSFVVDLEDLFCSIVKRPHNRSSTYMYLLVTEHGTWLKCYNSECHGKNVRLDEHRPPYISDLFPKKPDTLEDICGGGESGGDEETTVERPKKTRKKNKSKKRPAQEAIGDLMDSSSVEKSAIKALHDEDSERFDQPALTEYLNKFLAYIHQNDTYGIRLRTDQPFEICKKAIAMNKMEKFEIKVSPFAVWCKNDNRREFENVVFDTSAKKHPQSTLNLFSGYKAKMLDREIESEEIETFLYHLREVICRGNEGNYDYYIRWWAWFFQRGRTGVMIILLSELKGTGKNIVLELLAEHVIGDKYVAVTDKIDTVVQRFNAIMVEKALIVTNELKDISKSGKESSRVEDVLKTLIKDRLTAIEKKGMDTLTVPSTVNFHGTSNYEIPLKVDRDQRRYVFFDVSPHKKGDFKYFDELAAFVESHPDEIFTYLNQFDLKGWGPEKNLVQTEYTKRIQKAFVNPVHQFWYDSGYCDAEFDKTPYPKDPIYDQFDGWCKKNRKSTPSDIWFTRQITSMGYEVVKIQKSGDRGRYIRGTINRATKELMGVLDE